MKEDDQIGMETESQTTKEMNLWLTRLIEATHSNDELGVARAIKRYNQLQNKVRED
jgi:hypothetical protein